MIIKNCFNSLAEGLCRKPISLQAQKFICSKWVEPNGFETGLEVYNSLIKQKVKFVTKRRKVVSWYSCGPTVYDSAHIGNFCSYLNFDIIRRIMENFFGLNVIMVMNITDIDDKIINRSNEMKVNWKHLASACEKQFFQDLNSLNIKPPTVVFRVTDHIPDIIDFINDLINSGYGYTTSDGSVYFPVNKYSGYGKFQNLQEELSPSDAKENSQDFALWKAAKEGEPSWESPWGRGRPGWHIECSTLASKFLGESIDLHSGGVDLKFPHHENEEAQCCAKFGSSRWVNYWIHSGHLYTKMNEKMSKSLKNTTSLKEFLSGQNANTLRIFCLTVPYRNNKEFRTETIEKAAAIDRKFSQFVLEAESCLRGEGASRGHLDESILFKAIDDAEVNIRKSLSNDFDTSTVISELIHLISTTNTMLNSPRQTLLGPGSFTSLASVVNLVKKTLSDLGYSFNTKDSLALDKTDEIIDSAVNFRTKIREIALDIRKSEAQELLERKKTLLGACDEFRDDFLRNGVEVKDRGRTSSWNYAVGGIKETSTNN